MQSHTDTLRYELGGLVASMHPGPLGVTLSCVWRYTGTTVRTALLRGVMVGDLERLAWEETVMSFLEKTRPKTVERGMSVRPADDDFRRRYPALHEYLTADAFPDGSPRKTSTLNVFVDQDGWKASLKDRERELILFVTDRSFLGVLEALEAMVTSDSPAWRDDRWKDQKGGQKNGKKT